jgi:hypothetical protein
MIPGFEWACPGRSEVWGIRKLGAEKLLCGDSFFTRSGAPGYCPASQPIDPQPKCQACLDVMYRGQPRVPVPKPFGVCPVCGGLVPVEDGRVQPHGAFRVDEHGDPYETGEACLGVNLPVTGGRR